MIRKAHLFFILAFICLNSIAQQSFIFSGSILSENNDTLSFCNVTIKNKPSSGVLTSYEGSFSISVNLNDTLLISYLGYVPLEWVVKDKNPKIIHMKPLAVNLPTITVAPPKNVLTAKQVMEEMRKRMNQNEVGLDKNYKLHVNAAIKMTKNNNSFYKFNGNLELIKRKKEELYGYPQDSTKREQTADIDSIVFAQASSRPSYFPNFLFMPPSAKGDKASYYDYQFGEISFYEGQYVYHVKFHRRSGGGYCESGGFYLISKETFATLYVEMIARSCEVIKPGKNPDQLMIDYHQLKVSFSKSLPLYNRYKIEELASYTLKNALNKNTVYFKESTITVDKIEEIATEGNSSKLVPATVIFNKKNA